MKRISLFLAACVSLLAATFAFGGNDSVVTAVHSKVSAGYERQKTPTGSFKREYYALTKGVYLPGLTRDRSIDGVRYPQIARLVAQYLALQNYYLAEDSKSADLLLTITWGTTVPFSESVYRTNTEVFHSAMNTLAAANAAVEASVEAGEPQSTPDGIQSPERSVRDAARSQVEGSLLQLTAFEDIRRQANLRNARLLGYIDEINRRENPSRFGGAGDAYQDLVTDIESERYFLVLTAYDFRSAARGEKPRLLWSTRVSVQAQGNRFNETLAGMLRRAAPYFGQDSHRLIRRYEPDVKVDLGELIRIGYEPPTGAREQSDTTTGP